MSELETIIADDKVKLGGKEYRFRRFRMRQIRDVLQMVPKYIVLRENEVPVVDDQGKQVVGDDGTPVTTVVKVFDQDALVGKLLDEGLDDAFALVRMSCDGITDEEIDDLLPEEFIPLLMRIVKENADFFVKQLPQVIQQAAEIWVESNAGGDS